MKCTREWTAISLNQQTRAESGPDLHLRRGRSALAFGDFMEVADAHRSHRHSLNRHVMAVELALG